MFRKNKIIKLRGAFFFIRDQKLNYELQFFILNYEVEYKGACNTCQNRSSDKAMQGVNQTETISNSTRESIL